MERRLEVPLGTENGPVTRSLYGPMDGAGLVSEQAIIGRSLVIKGEISGVEALYIDGRVEGVISVPENRVTVGPVGSVLSNIHAREVVVMGTVTGNLNSSDRADIRNGCSVTGKVIAKRVSVEDGAMMKGSVEVRDNADRNASHAARTETGGDQKKDSSGTESRQRKTHSDQSASQVEGSSVLLSVKQVL